MALLTIRMRLVSLFPVLLVTGLVACSSGASPSPDPEEGAPGTDALEHGMGKGETAQGDATSADSTIRIHSDSTVNDTTETTTELETLTLGSGCFWCSEAVLEQVEGVRDVVSGYMGGDTPDPTYKEVCTGRTGHAEVVQVRFDPKVLPLDDLLAWFWKLHDPTTLNRQGADVGTQYRSAIFYHSEAQREAALRSMEAAQADFSDPIVTEITAAGTFYPAEDYHQDYYRANKNQGYCRAVIAPKLDKLDLEK